MRGAGAFVQDLIKNQNRIGCFQHFPGCERFARIIWDMVISCISGPNTKCCPLRLKGNGGGAGWTLSKAPPQPGQTRIFSSSALTSRGSAQLCAVEQSQWQVPTCII